MIIFKEFTENKKGIQFESLQHQTTIVKIMDEYTGICSYKTEIQTTPGYLYFFSHLSECHHRCFEVWDELEKNILLKIGVVNDQVPSIGNEDKYNVLKNFSKNNDVTDTSISIPLYEIFVNKLYDKFFSIKKGDVVVDIGGNMGFFSYYAVCKEASKVYCFEPSTKDCDIIKKNFSFPNLILEEAAVSSQDGFITFYYNKDNSITASTYQPGENTEAIICKSINFNNYIKNNNIEKIDYLKIDCEGAEYEIIESLDEYYLTNNVDKICLEYHFNTDKKLNTLIEKLKKCNFTINFEFGDYQINDELGIIYAYKQK